MRLDDFIQRLQKVKKTGEHRWQALCPAHHDKQASLSVTVGKSQPIVLCCHAGCSTEEICAALGLKSSDLCEDRVELPPVRADKGKIVATYDYLDEEGKLLYQTVRLEPKDFRQRVPDGNGRWKWGLAGVRRVPYHLPQLVNARDSGKAVLLVEGEKDVEAAEALGFVATTTSGGANGWRAECAECFGGLNVACLPDNDKPGRDYAHKSLTGIYPFAASVKLIQLPGLPEKGDLCDWVGAGGTAEALQALIGTAPEWEPGEETECRRQPGAYTSTVLDTLNDAGNAERLIAAHGTDLRYCPDKRAWFVWDGRVWRQDDTSEVHRLAKRVVRDMYALLADLSGDHRQKVYSFINRSLNSERLKAMLEEAQKEAGVIVRLSSMDCQHWLLPCEDGVIDLRTGALREHRREDYFTKLVRVRFDQSAKCDRWERFLDEVFCGDAELIAYAQKLAGYVLTGDCSEQSFFVLAGKGSNGKGVFVRTLGKLLGHYAKDCPVTTFLERRSENTCDLASLAGARMVTASEGEDTSSFNESLIKRLSGQDPVTARFNRMDFFTYEPTFKILFSTNEIPRIRSQNYAMKRRVKLIPFRQRFYYPHEEKLPVRDEHLEDKLSMELPGILAWAVRGCLDWQRHGLGMPDAVMQEVSALFVDQDPLAVFIESRCILHPGVKEESGVMWRAYVAWCESEKRTLAVKTTSGFSRNLNSRDGIELQKGTKGARFLSGICLTESETATGVATETEETASKERRVAGYAPPGVNAKENTPHYGVNGESSDSRHLSPPGEESCGFPTASGKCIQCVELVELEQNGGPEKDWQGSCQKCGRHNSIPNWRIGTWRKDDKE